MSPALWFAFGFVSGIASLIGAFFGLSAYSEVTSRRASEDWARHDEVYRRDVEDRCRRISESVRAQNEREAAEGGEGHV